MKNNVWRMNIGANIFRTNIMIIEFLLHQKIMDE